MNLYAGSMFHVMWIGDVFESDGDYHLLLALFFLFIATMDLSALYLYYRIALDSTTRPQVNGDFSNSI